jgi:hypothetical protein
VANILTGILAGVSLLAAFLVLTAPINTIAAAAYDLNAPLSAQYKEILVRTGLITFLTIILNIYGTIALVGGAIYSAYIFWRKRVLLDRMIGNILIAAGALMPAMAGTLIGAGLADFLYLSEFIGVVLMYTGFLKATAQSPVESKNTVPASAG